MAEEEVKVRMVLDPEGFRSQIEQFKGELGLSLQGAQYSVGQTLGAASAGYNSLSSDVGSMFSRVLTAPSSPIDVSTIASSAIHGLVPGLTAPHSYDVKEWGEMHRNILVDTTSRAAVNVGLGALSGASKMLLEGAAYGAVSGALLPAAATAFAGGVPAALAITAADHLLFGGAISSAASHTADRLLDPIMAPHMAGVALAAGGARIGLHNSVHGDVAAGVYAVGNAGGLTGNETMTILQAGLETGAFGQASGPADFTQKFRELMNGAKEISRSMHTELADAVQLISSMQTSGFGTIQSSIDAIRMSRITAATTGITVSEGVALAQAGAAMTVGNLGMSAQYGAASTQANFEAVTEGLRTRTIDQETMAQLGGRARAAQAMTMSNLGYLEGPMGRAGLLAAFDQESGHLDTSAVNFEPGMAYRKAMENIQGSGSPMRMLTEFAGKRARLASETTPEEAALGQVAMWAEMARHIDPKGPITTDLLVGAAFQAGTNPDLARAQIGAVMAGPDTVRARIQALRDQRRADKESSGEFSVPLISESTRSRMWGYASDAFLGSLTLGVYPTVRAMAGSEAGQTFIIESKSNLSRMASNTKYRAERMLDGASMEATDLTAVSRDFKNSVIEDLAGGTLNIGRSARDAAIRAENAAIDALMPGRMLEGGYDKKLVHDTISKNSALLAGEVRKGAGRVSAATIDAITHGLDAEEASAVRNMLSKVEKGGKDKEGAQLAEALTKSSSYQIGSAMAEAGVGFAARYGGSAVEETIAKYGSKNIDAVVNLVVGSKGGDAISKSGLREFAKAFQAFGDKEELSVTDLKSLGAFDEQNLKEAAGIKGDDSTLTKAELREYTKATFMRMGDREGVGDSQTTMINKLMRVLQSLETLLTKYNLTPN